MRNRAARVARMTIATSKPKSTDIVADIPESLLSTLYGAWFLRVEEHEALQEHKKTPGPADQASRRTSVVLLLTVYHITLHRNKGTGRKEGEGRGYYEPLFCRCALFACERIPLLCSQLISEAVAHARDGQNKTRVLREPVRFFGAIGLRRYD